MRRHVAEMRSKTVDEISGRPPKKAAAGREQLMASGRKRSASLRHDGKKSGGKVKIKWVVSFISCTDDMRQTIRGLGLRRMHQVVERAGHAGNARHDPQGAASRGSGGVSAWPKKCQADPRSGKSASTNGDSGIQARRSFTLANLRPPRGSRKQKCASAAASAPKLGKNVAAPATRGRNRGAAIRAAAGLKAARCRCTAACPSAASTIRSA